MLSLTEGPIQPLEEDVLMATVDKSIVVDVPVSAAYNQWTQFEEFPKFMEGVEEVSQQTDSRVHWRTRIAGKEQEWDAEIVQQLPDRRVAWKSIDGTANSGEVVFEPIDSRRTKIVAHMEYEPEGVAENVGDKLGLVSRRVEADLERFKTYIESLVVETGEWRGQIGTA
jgi:uncharacterized membrane protein